MKKKKKKKCNFRPIFQPSHVQVVMDEGVEEMEGSYITLQIKDIQYDANNMRIIVRDYRR